MQMKLSVKMTALFSVMMLAALAVLSSFALKTSIAGATSFTESRFNNMAVAIRRDLEQDIAMMELTMNSLIENPSFLAALNQMIRDDTADHKVGQAATQLALQQLYQSPMVDNYYRVSFYTREGLFLSSLADKDSSLVSGSEETQAIVCALPWLDQADSITDYLILSPHADVFSPGITFRYMVSYSGYYIMATPSGIWKSARNTRIWSASWALWTIPR